MLIKGSRRYNLRHNSSLRDGMLPHRMINGQAMGRVSEMRYGLCHMSFNGCEVISVYNALLWQGRPQELWEIAGTLERSKVLLGIFGCSPYKLGRALGKYGAAFERIRRITPQHDAFIVSFWTGRRFLSSIHTVFCVRKATGILVYNRYNNCPNVQLCKTLEEVIGRKRPIAAYWIKSDKKENDQ
ncbi:MAG: hypothetical protein IJ071_09405 [Ruminococcus sp.]|nr:hypothetical protein [Ruminococcus sp.]